MNLRLNWRSWMGGLAAVLIALSLSVRVSAEPETTSTRWSAKRIARANLPAWKEAVGSANRERDAIGKGLVMAANASEKPSLRLVSAYFTMADVKSEGVLEHCAKNIELHVPGVFPGRGPQDRERDYPARWVLLRSGWAAVTVLIRQLDTTGMSEARLEHFAYVLQHTCGRAAGRALAEEKHAASTTHLAAKANYLALVKLLEKT